MDALDVASEFEAHEREYRIHQARALPTGPSAEECVTCGEEIPAERRQAIPGVQHCVTCKSRAELKRRIVGL